MIGGGRTLLRVNLGNTDTHPLHNADFQSTIFARSVSAVTASKKVQLTRIGSPLRAFQSV